MSNQSTQKYPQRGVDRKQLEDDERWLEEHGQSKASGGLMKDTLRTFGDWADMLWSAFKGPEYGFEGKYARIIEKAWKKLPWISKKEYADKSDNAKDADIVFNGRDSFLDPKTGKALSPLELRKIRLEARIRGIENKNPDFDRDDLPGECFHPDKIVKDEFNKSVAGPKVIPENDLCHDSKPAPDPLKIK